MTEPAYVPVGRDELIQALAHGLRYEGRRRTQYADELMARAAAEKILDHLARSNFVVVRGPGAPAHTGPAGFRTGEPAG